METTQDEFVVFQYEFWRVCRAAGYKSFSEAGGLELWKKTECTAVFEDHAAAD